MAFPRKILRRALAPAAWLYYRWLFGRGWAGADRWMRRFEERTASGDSPVSGDAWDEQYRAGRWDLLHDSAELARYGALLAFCERLTPGRTFLDVGCGDGRLRDLLRRGGYERYVGVDLSEVAIERARRDADPRDMLVAADAEAYDPGSSFDAVVLNESLYYFRAPLEQAERYLAMVGPAGALVVSMFESRRTRAIARALARRLPLTEEARVTGHRGTWSLQVFKADSPNAPTPP